jgi:hypothetical protein
VWRRGQKNAKSNLSVPISDWMATEAFEEPLIKGTRVQGYLKPKSFLGVQVCFGFTLQSLAIPSILTSREVQILHSCCAAWIYRSCFKALLGLGAKLGRVDAAAGTNVNNTGHVKES